MKPAFLALALGLVFGRQAEVPNTKLGRQALHPQPWSPHASSFVDGTFNGRNYKLYVPGGYTGTAIPLVLMLHGCDQTPAGFAAGTQMNALAETATFFALYPEQSSGKNAGLCWNWFEPTSQTRGSGEPAELVGILDHVAATYQVDSTKVYAAGLSAGAAMSVVLGATYPNRFSAITVASGLEFKAATSASGAFTAMSSGGPTPKTQGTAAKTAMGAAARAVRVLVIHGSADDTVAPVNGNQVLSQWAQTNDLASDGTDDDNIDDVADATDTLTVAGGYSATRTSYTNASSGKIVMQKIVVTGMGHAWSGGDPSGNYTDAKGPNATQLSWSFFTDGLVLPSVDAGTLDDFAVPPSDGFTSSDAAATSGADAAGTIGPGGAGTSGCALAGHGSAASGTWVALVALVYVILRRRP